MSPRRPCCVALLLYTLTLLPYTNGQADKQERSRAVWYNARNLHDGLGLSDAELRTLSSLAGNMDQFKSLLDPIMIPRIVGTAGHADVRKHLVDTMRNLNWDVQEDAFDNTTPYGRKTFTNVIATLNPDAPRHLVLACHYDSKIDSRGVFLGATDSAVPCAMLLHLATQLHSTLEVQKKENPDLTLQFIFFDGEEAFVRWSRTDSLYGARNLAAKLHNQPYPPRNNDQTTHLHRMDLFVLLDLLGTRDMTFFNYFKDTERWYGRMAAYEKQLNDMNLLNKRPLMFKAQSRLGSGIQDDHIPFLKRGVPVLHIIPVPFPSVWHTLEDNYSALHYPTIDNFNRILFAFTADYLHLVL